MRHLFFTMPFLVVIASAQTMTEVGASAAGSAIGSAAGKKVSEGVTGIFGALNKTTAKAAKAPEDKEKSAPLLEVGPGAPKASLAASGGESVPPPPPPAGHRAIAKPTVAAEPVLPEIIPPPPPPPPAVTLEDLKKVTNGMSREDVLKLGAPSSKITMSDDGHLFETFSYWEKDTAIGRVKLTDGTVSSVEMR